MYLLSKMHVTEDQPTQCERKRQQAAALQRGWCSLLACEQQPPH